MGFQPVPSVAAAFLAPGKSQLVEAACVLEQHGYCPAQDSAFGWWKVHVQYPSWHT